MTHAYRISTCRNKTAIQRTVRQEGISRNQSYLVSSDREQMIGEEKEKETARDTRAAQKSARLTNTKTNVIRGIQDEIEERNFYQIEDVIAIRLVRWTRPSPDLAGAEVNCS